jgi:hypothetical protein
MRPPQGSHAFRFAAVVAAQLQKKKSLPAYV